MSYSSAYTDEYGYTRDISITEEDSAEALKNDYQEIVRKYNPKYVTIQRVQAKPGEAMHIKVTVKAPSHYLTTNDDSTPKACEAMTVDIICYPGYPLKSVSASYASDYYLASPNVFRSGSACIDTWIPLTSSLTTVVDKLVHDMIHEKFPQYVTDANITIGHKKKVITRANRIIAISENTKKDIIEIFNINPQKIDVIYHSTSMKHFSGKHKLQIPESFLLFVGDRTPYKNFKRFMETFAQIHEQDKTLFAIYTGSKLKKDEQDMLIGMGIFEYTIHIKASDQALSELYSRALLFVYPSLYEGFGIPILEAYACHCPVALSNTSCFPEIAGDAAVYFDPYSISSMSEAITKVIYNEEKRSQLIRLGNERLKRYSWEKAAQKTEEAYQKAIQS